MFHQQNPQRIRHLSPLLLGMLCLAHATRPATAFAQDPPVAVATEIRTGPPARVVVHSDGAPVVVSQVTGHSDASGSGYSYGRHVTVSAKGQSWSVICQSPCEFAAPSGNIELMFGGDGVLKAQKHVQLASGDNYIDISPGSPGLEMTGLVLSALGASTLILGGTLLLVSAALDTDDGPDDKYGKYGVPLMVGGGAFLVGGLVLTSLNDTEVAWGRGAPPNHPPATARQSRRVGVAVRGVF